MENTFSFLFQQLHPFKGTPVRGRMNPRFKKHFPSAVHQAPHPLPGQSAGTGLGGLRPRAASPLRGSPPTSLKGGHKACRGRGGVEEYILPISKRKPGTWYLILESNHGLNCILLQSCLNIKGKSTGIVQHQD